MQLNLHTYPLLGPVVETSRTLVRTMDYATINAKLAANESRRWAEYAKVAHRLQNRVIPEAVRDVAARYAPQLVATMRENTSRMQRHRTSGALDTSKLVRLARPSSPAQFERDAATAYRARAQTPNSAPLKIAIVSDMNWRVRAANKDYVEKVGTLGFIVSDAAIVAGLKCASYGVRGIMEGFMASGCFPAGVHKYKSLISILANYGERISPVAFATHVDHVGYVGPFRYALNGGGGGSRNGTGGIDYAREHDGATFVVGIGRFDDLAKPDVLLPPDTSVDDAVRAIHSALQAFQARAA